MRNRLLGLPQRKLLKCNAVSKVNLSCDVNEITPRNRRHLKRKLMQSAFERLHELSPKKIYFEAENEIEADNNKSNVNDLEIKLTNDNVVSDNISECPNCKDKQECIDNLKNKIIFLENCNKILKNREKKNFRMFAQRQKRWTTSRKKFVSEIQKLKSQTAKFRKKQHRSENLEKRLQHIFTKTQINALLEKKEKIRWTSEDISRCIVIRALSSKSYDFWKEKMGIPLPSTSTLKRWCAKFSCSPGIQSDVLAVMKERCEYLNSVEKICVLSFDEMHIDSKLCYDSKLDQILGPFQKVQFVLIRGLISQWKQPIFFDFNTPMKQELLFSLIRHIQSSGVEVKAIVSDLGGSSTLWKELQISINSSEFPNPVLQTKKIWVFADLAHCLKLLRNHFLDKGFILEDGTVLNVDIIKEVLNRDSGEIKLCHKLKPNYLMVKGNERQKVAPAKTLFSRTTAKGILHLTGNQKASDFFELIDSFFDIMNSTKPYPPSDKILKAAFGLNEHHEKQIQVLELMKKVIGGLRVQGKSNMLPFQKGIIISINSLFDLHQDLKSSYDAKYILTSRLTHDALESLFSQIRGLDRFNDHPSPKEPSPMAWELELNSARQFSTAEKEALTYVAGYIAYRVRDKDPSLGTISKNSADEPIFNSEWIKLLSLGGLTSPSHSWMNTVYEFENIFCAVHGTTYYKGKHVIGM
ncbi:Transposable element P transposase, partial [Stegodyphus mimosarum]